MFLVKFPTPLPSVTLPSPVSFNSKPLPSSHPFSFSSNDRKRGSGARNFPYSLSLYQPQLPLSKVLPLLSHKAGQSPQVLDPSFLNSARILPIPSNILFPSSTWAKPLSALRGRLTPARCRSQAVTGKCGPFQVLWNEKQHKNHVQLMHFIPF